MKRAVSDTLDIEWGMMNVIYDSVGGLDMYENELSHGYDLARDENHKSILRIRVMY